jgi:hypothetical protein
MHLCQLFLPLPPLLLLPLHRANLGSEDRTREVEHLERGFEVVFPVSSVGSFTVFAFAVLVRVGTFSFIARGVFGVTTKVKVGV